MLAADLEDSPARQKGIVKGRPWVGQGTPSGFRRGNRSRFYPKLCCRSPVWVEVSWSIAGQTRVLLATPASWLAIHISGHFKSPDLVENIRCRCTVLLCSWRLVYARVQERASYSRPSWQVARPVCRTQQFPSHALSPGGTEGSTAWPGSRRRHGWNSCMGARVGLSGRSHVCIGQPAHGQVSLLLASRTCLRQSRTSLLGKSTV